MFLLVLEKNSPDPVTFGPEKTAKQSRDKLENGSKGNHAHSNQHVRITKFPGKPVTAGQDQGDQQPAAVQQVMS